MGKNKEVADRFEEATSFLAETRETGLLGDEAPLRDMGNRSRMTRRALNAAKALGFGDPNVAVSIAVETKKRGTAQALVPIKISKGSLPHESDDPHS